MLCSVLCVVMSVVRSVCINKMLDKATDSVRCSLPSYFYPSQLPEILPYLAATPWMTCDHVSYLAGPEIDSISLN